MLKERAYAKVNLHLQVTGCREDGYHTLQTVFARISLYDDVFIEAVREPVVELEVEGDYRVPGGSGNVAYKAAKWYLKRYGIKGWGVKIVIHKRIPPGSGLGAGSADAGAVIRALVKFFGERDPDIVKDAVEIGADVPFFVSGYSVAYAEGVGEELIPLESAVVGKSLWLVIPSVSVSTNEVFRVYDRVKEEAEKVYPPLPRERIVEIAREGEVEAFGEHFFNHLEVPVFDMYPEVERCKKQLLYEGCPFVMMSGSGSSVFAMGKRPQTSAIEVRIL